MGKNYRENLQVFVGAALGTALGAVAGTALGRERAAELGRVRECEQTNAVMSRKEGETDCPKEGAADCPKEGRPFFPGIGLEGQGLHFNSNEEAEAEYQKNRLKPPKWSEALNRKHFDVRLRKPFRRHNFIYPTQNAGVKLVQYEADGQLVSGTMTWPCLIIKCQYVLSSDWTKTPFLTVVIAVPKLQNGNIETDCFSYDVFDGDNPRTNNANGSIPTGFISGSHSSDGWTTHSVFDLLCINQH